MGPCHWGLARGIDGCKRFLGLPPWGWILGRTLCCSWGEVGETEYDQVWAWEEAMHVSAMNGLIRIRIIREHYGAMAYKPKLTKSA
jgi:hypothetical protein